MIDQRVKTQMKAEAHDRTGPSMALATQIRKAGYTAKRCELGGDKTIIARTLLDLEVAADGSILFDSQRMPAGFLYSTFNR